MRRDAAAFSLLPLLMGAGLLLAVLALAGPAWHSRDVPVHRVKQARIVVLDLSRSMDAPDVQPSRLARARLKAAEVFAMTGEGQAGLVVFAGDAFAVSPLTDDGATLTAMLPALSTDLMPARGSRADLGLRRAGELLAQAGQTRGEVILIADSAEDFRAVEAAAALARDGFSVSALALGTPEGAPIPLAEGGFLTDDAGRIVVPRAGTKELREVARAGGGRFAKLSGDHRDLEFLLASSARSLPDTEESEHEAAPLARRRTVAGPRPSSPSPRSPFGAAGCWRSAACSSCRPNPCARGEWRDLWSRPDQQASAALGRGDPVAAIEAAGDGRWRAPALYRNREYVAAGDAYAALPGADAHYNRGNALARAGRLRDALHAYDASLAIAPDLEDALFNRRLVEELLRESPAGGGREERGEEGGSRSAAGDGAQPFGPDDRDPDGGDPRGEPPGPQLEGMESGDSEADAGSASASRERESRSGTGRAELGEVRGGASEGLRASAAAEAEGELSEEQRQALEQWLRRIPDDPGGLLRRKFALDYQRRGSPDPDSPRTW